MARRAHGELMAKGLHDTAIDAVANAKAAVILRRWRVTFGDEPKFYGRPPMLRVRGTMAVGDNFRVRSHQFRTQITVAPGASFRVGDNCDINQGCNLYIASVVEIGDNVGFADLVTLADTNFHEVLPGSGVKTKPITIEDNVWIARGVTILAGVVIGRHSVVGAGSVVSRDVPPKSVVAGNPARVIREFECADDYVRH
jgi:acetyltransferase-like isoleucine patch superfamily enzyme